jgi:hypothetical protein
VAGLCELNKPGTGAPDVVTDLDFVCAVYLLNDQATVADQFTTRSQNHGPKTVAVFGVAAPVAGDPFVDSRTIQRRGIETHGFRVGENIAQRVRIVRREFAQDQAWCIQDLRGVRHGFPLGFL